MTTRRIGYLVSQYPTVSHTFILREIRGLRAQGWDIQSISIGNPDRPSDKLSAEEEEERRRTLYVKSAGVGPILAAHFALLLKRPAAFLATMLYAVRLGHPSLHKLLYFAEAVVVGTMLEKHGYRHVHVHFSTTVALLMARLFPITFSETIHGSDEFIDPKGFAMAEKVAAAKLTVAISLFGQSQVMRFSDAAHWDRIAVCRLGIHPRVFDRAAKTGESNPFRLISVGRLVSVKGLPILLEAMELLKQRGRRVVLSLAGGGPEMERFRARVQAKQMQDMVILEGWCDQTKVRALYAESDAFVLASFAEGVPVVLMEAMAMRLPCIATRITGIPELIEDGVSGLLVTPSDAAGLAAAVERLMDDAALRQAMAEAGRERVLREYDLDQNIPQLSALYEERLSQYLG